MADIPHVGFSAIAVADGDPARADALVEGLLDMAWQRRAEFVYGSSRSRGRSPPRRRSARGRSCWSTTATTSFSGGTQDVMAMVAEVLRQGLEEIAIGPIWDPASVQRMIEAGEGAAVTLELGGKTEMPAIGLAGEPLPISGRVRADHRRPVHRDLADGDRGRARPRPDGRARRRARADPGLLEADGAVRPRRVPPCRHRAHRASAMS